MIDHNCAETIFIDLQAGDDEDPIYDKSQPSVVRSDRAPPLAKEQHRVPKKQPKETDAYLGWSYMHHM